MLFGFPVEISFFELLPWHLNLFIAFVGMFASLVFYHSEFLEKDFDRD